MFGNVGTVKTMSNPSAGDISGMITMLESVGGDKKIKKLLEKMQEVQAHNETVLADARSLKTQAEAAAAKANVAIDKAEQGQAQLAIAQEKAWSENKEARSVRTYQEQALADQIAIFEKDKTTFAARAKDYNEQIIQGNKDISARTSTLDKRENDCAELKEILNTELTKYILIGHQVASAVSDTREALSKIP